VIDRYLGDLDKWLAIQRICPQFIFLSSSCPRRFPVRGALFVRGAMLPFWVNGSLFGHIGNVAILAKYPQITSLFGDFANPDILGKWLAICPFCQSWHFRQMPANRLSFEFNIRVNLCKVLGAFCPGKSVAKFTFSLFLSTL